MSLRRNTLWNLAGTGLPLLVGAVTIPYLIKQAGIEAFGVLTLIWALIGYFSLFDFGLGRALTQQVAKTLATGDHARVPSMIRTGLGFTVATGLGGGLLLAVLASALATRWLKVSPDLQHETLVALWIAAVGIPLTTITTGLRGVLEAYEDFRVVNLLRIGLGVANFALPALSVMLVSKSLVWMVAGLICARFVVLLAHVQQVHIRLPAGWMSGGLSKGNLRELLSFGAWMAVSNVISPLMVTADRFVISAVLGATVVAYYTVPFEALIRVLVVPTALTAALFPRLSASLVTNPDQAKGLYRRCLRLVTLFLLPICLLIALGSWWGLRLWVGTDFADHSWMIVCVLSLGLLLNGVAFVPFAAIQSSGDARTTAYLHLAELVLYVPALFVCLHYFGLIGAAIAWSARVGLDLMVLIMCAKRNGF